MRRHAATAIAFHDHASSEGQAPDRPPRPLCRVAALRTAIVIMALLGLARVGSAQTLPTPTQDPEPIGAGKVAVGVGESFSRADVFPVSGLTGTLVQSGLLNVRVGISSIADVQLTGGVNNHLSITSRDSSAPDASLLTVSGTTTNDVEDAVLGTRVRFLAETPDRPAVAAEFSVRLPNSKHPSGLGMDTMDFHLGFLGGKSNGAVRVVANLGWSILEDPVRIGIQNDVITYGGSVTLPVATNVAVVADLAGRWSSRHGTPPVGTESRSLLRGSARYSSGAFHYDAGVLVGLTSFDPSWGIWGNVTWVVSAFKIP
jgi:hypothetical protein